MSTVDPSGPDLTRRIEELASYAADDSDTPAVTVLVSAVRAEIGAVRAELGSLRSEVGAVRTDLDDVLGTLRSALEQRLDGVGERVHRTVTTALEQEARTSAGTQASLVDARGALESRLAVLEEVLDAMSERLESLARDGASTTTDRLAEVVASVVALERRTEELRDDVVGALDRGATESTASREAVSALADTVSRALDGFGEALDRSLSGLGGTVSTALAEGRETSRSDLVDVAERLAGSVSGLQDDLGSRAEAGRAALAGLRSAVEDRLEAVRTQVAAALADARTDVATEVGPLRPQVAELTAASVAASEGFSALRVELAESTQTLREEVLERVEQVFPTVVDRVGELAAVVDGSAGETRELQQRAAELAEAAGSFRTSLEEALEVVRDEVVEAGRDLRKELLPKVDGQAARLLERLTELGTSLGGGQREVAERLGAVDDVLQRNTTAVEQAADEVVAVAESTDVLGGIVAGFRRDWPTRSLEVVQGAKAAAEATVGQVRQEVGGKLDEVVDALAEALGGVDRARSTIDTGTKRLSAAGQVLVGYLEERDRLLEAERDRMLHEVLDEFAAGLSARDRTALRERMGDAVARRRDVRDAKRYRAAVGTPKPPVVDLPDDVIALVPPRPAPAPPAPAPRSAARRPEAPGPSARTTAAGNSAAGARAPAKKAAATRPATKKAPAKKAAANAPAKKAPAKNPPARNPPARNPPA